MLSRSKARRGLTLLWLLLLLAVILLAMLWFLARPRAAPPPGSLLDLVGRARAVQSLDW